MKKTGDVISEIELEESWEDILSTFDMLIDNGHKLRPIRFLIRHVIEKGYSKNLYAGSSLYSLLISLPIDMTIDFTKTLRVEMDWLTPTVKFQYQCKFPRPKEPEWIETCQPTEIIDIFEYFLQTQDDWGKIKKRHANNN